MREAQSGDGRVFLDLARDEYSCCYDPAEPRGEYCLLMSSVQGIGLDHAHAVLLPRWIEPPQWDFPRPSAHDIVCFSAAMARASSRFYGRSICELAWAVRHLATKSPAGDLTLHQASGLFRYLMSLTPFKPRCLFGSFALLHFLSLQGFRADWVFGVRLFPFRAHCWVEADNILLNERSHAVEDFSVIWTVGPRPL